MPNDSPAPLEPGSGSGTAAVVLETVATLARETNHASYLDGIVLLAVAPERCAFVAKRELTRNALARLLLGRIGTRFVERFAIEDSVEAARELAAQAAQGTSFAFFPEGRLQREPGLLPFHLGAFQAAAAAGTPLVPVAIRGTRSVLRDGQ